jgi:hypothetical protein
VSWSTATKRARQPLHRITLLPHQRGIVVASAGVVPPACPPETIKQAADCLKTFTPKM